MKRFFMMVCLSCIGSFFLPEAGAKFSPPSTPVNLYGKLGGSGLVRSQPVEAFLCSSSVEVVFNADLGMLTVEVMDETGNSVYQKKVDAKTDGTLAINTGGWGSGEYTLIITDGLGGCLEGSFLIN